jgi:hypothetical protein
MTTRILLSGASNHITGNNFYFFNKLVIFHNINPKKNFPTITYKFLFIQHLLDKNYFLLIKKLSPVMLEIQITKINDGMVDIVAK